MQPMINLERTLEKSRINNFDIPDQDSRTKE